MKISPWHMEIAKRVAEGQKYQEISKEIQISQSRLSVLKANSLFCRQVEKYRKILDDGYEKAVGVFNKEAEKVAEEVVRIATTPAVQPQTRLHAAKEVLDRLGMSVGTGQSTRAGEDEVSFEQILRVTKKKSTSPELNTEEDFSSAATELNADLEGLENITPEELRP